MDSEKNNKLISGGLTEVEARAVLVDNLKNGLMKQAGYVAGVDDRPVEKPILQGFLYPLEYLPQNIRQVWEWSKGRGWICGSAALWAYSDSRDSDFTAWHYGDIDVFARDDACYEAMVGELRDTLWCVETEYSFKIEACYLNKVSVGDLNIIRPPEGVSWRNHQTVWEAFDLNAAQCTIISPEWVMVAGTLHLVGWNAENKPALWPSFGIRHAARFIYRVNKYLERGFRLPADFWFNVLDFADMKSEALKAEYVSLLRFLAAVQPDAMKAIVKYTESAVGYAEGEAGGGGDSYEEYDYREDEYDDMRGYS